MIRLSKARTKHGEFIPPLVALESFFQFSWCEHIRNQSGLYGTALGRANLLWNWSCYHWNSHSYTGLNKRGLLLI